MPHDPTVETYIESGQHPSPLYDFLTAFAPRKLKDMFRLTEYLYYNSAQIYAAIQKFAIYPVTEITYVSSTNEELKKKYKQLHNKILKTKKILTLGALDKYVYGNAFFSLYTPFIRFLRCTRCKRLSNIEQTNYTFTLKKLEFKFECLNCKQSTIGQVVDRKLTRQEKLNIIRWDPKLMDIDYNPITGHSKYYFTIPKQLKEQVIKGNKHLINTLPMEFIRAVRSERVFEFAEGKLFHMKMGAPAGIEAQWGFPPLASTVKLFFYASVLRKANEAIALDYVVPMRIISPRASSANADPLTTMSLNRWTEEMKTSVKKWRKDPLHIMWSPVPAEVTHLGGQARALMTLGEVQEAEANIIAAMGIPKEFIYGGLSYAGSAITLRMLENQLIAHTADLNDLLQWITDEVAKALGWSSVEVELSKFKLVDDVEQKRLILALNENPQKPLISDESIADQFGFDLEEERKKRFQNMIDEVRAQQTFQQEAQQLQSTMAQKIQAQMAMGGAAGVQYDQQAVIAQAEQLVQQLMSMDPGMRKSQLHSLQTEDYVMYSVVVQRLEEAQKSMQNEAKAQISGGGGQPI